MHRANYKCNDLIHINDDSPMSNVTKIKFHRPSVEGGKGRGRGRGRGDNRVALTAATLARKRYVTSIRLCLSALLRKPPLLSERGSPAREAREKTCPENRESLENLRVTRIRAI